MLFMPLSSQQHSILLDLVMNANKSPTIFYHVDKSMSNDACTYTGLSKKRQPCTESARALFLHNAQGRYFNMWGPTGLLSFTWCAEENLLSF